MKIKFEQIFWKILILNPCLRHSILHDNTLSIKSSSKKQFNYLNQINFPNLSNNGDLVSRVSTITHYIRISQKIGNTAIRDVNWDYCLGPNRTEYSLFRLKPSLHPHNKWSSHTFQWYILSHLSVESRIVTETTKLDYICMKWFFFHF